MSFYYTQVVMTTLSELSPEGCLGRNLTQITEMERMQLGPTLRSVAHRPFYHSYRENNLVAKIMESIVKLSVFKSWPFNFSSV